MNTALLNQHLAQILGAKDRDEEVVSQPSEYALLILRAQQKSNELVAGKDWYTKNLDFLKAARIEMGEALEHHSWKWWAKQNEALQPDVPGQIALELADAAKFIVSDLLSLTAHTTAESLQDDNIFAAVGSAHLQDAMEYVQGSLVIKSSPAVRQALKSAAYRSRKAANHETGSILANEKEAATTSYVAYFEDDLYETMGGVCRVNKHVSHSAKDLVTQRTNLLSSLFSYSYALGYNPVAMFFAKSVLFDFRMNNGYKDGTYNKMWPIEGTDEVREDNYFLPHMAAAAWIEAESGSKIAGLSPSGVVEVFNTALLHRIEVEYDKRFAL